MHSCRHDASRTSTSKDIWVALSVLLASALLVSCGEERTDSESHESDAPSTHSEPPTSGMAIVALELDDGHKWKVDDHTRSVFAEMKEIFLGADHRSLGEEGLKKTGADLQAKLHELIRGCTMTGAAHDQLHVYLTGYMPAVATLAETGRMEEAMKVEHYLVTFGEYFE